MSKYRWKQFVLILSSGIIHPFHSIKQGHFILAISVFCEINRWLRWSISQFGLQSWGKEGPVTDPASVFPDLKMAAALDPDEVLRSSKGRDNFQRLARLLISGGTVLLREAFDIKCPPSNLSTTLQNPATKKLLKAAKLTKPQRNCL